MCKRLLYPGAFVLLALGAACSGDTTSIVCTTEARAAISLTIQDSVTAARFPFSSVLVVASDGTYRDSSRVATIDATNASFGVGLAYERAGTYAIDVTASGYAPWRMSGIVVTKADNGCHVQGQSIVARLKKT